MPEKEVNLICPFCHSDNVIRKKKVGYLIVLSILLFGLPLPLFKKKFYCFDCEKEWKENNKPSV